jgi:hypothetical protein
VSTLSSRPPRLTDRASGRRGRRFKSCHPALFGCQILVRDLVAVGVEHVLQFVAEREAPAGVRIAAAYKVPVEGTRKSVRSS